MIAKTLRGLRAMAGGRPVEVAGEVERRPWVLHPFLIGIFPIVSLYAHNVYETSPRAMALPIALVLSSTFAIWLVLRALSGDAAKAGLSVSLLVAAFFGFQSLNRAADQLWGWANWVWVYREAHVEPLFVMAFLTVAVGVASLAIFRRSGRFARLTRVLNVFAALMVALPAVGAISARMREPASAPHEAALPTVARSGWTPDIYFLVLDGYARSDVMKELFQYDNEPFLRRLEARGFFAARQSNSNYCQTRLSIASTLNANYLDKLIDPSTRDLLPLTELITGNLVRKSLKPLGYKFVSFATGFEPTDVMDADTYFYPRPANPEFTQLLVEMTPLGAWFSEVELDDRYKAIRDRTLYLLDRLPEVARRKEPTFTFAHVIGPHPPFVFGEGGEDVSPRRLILGQGGYAPVAIQGFGTPAYFREAYRKQSIFLTNRIEAAIEQILANSPEPPVIILQSDHGSWLRYHPDDLEATDLRERFGILNCIYAPPGKLDGLDDKMTSVNTFRLVLRSVIGADLPPLPDRNFFSPFHNPLEFTDVTERLHSPAERVRTFTYPPDYLGLDQQF